MVDIKTTSIPAKPRSKNYPAGTVITRTTGSITVNGGGGGGASVDIVKATDTKSFTDSNVLSSAPDTVRDPFAYHCRIGYNHGINR